TSSYDLLDGAPLDELAKPTRFQNLYLVPSKPELAGAVVELARRSDGDRYLADSLAHAGDDYRFVFLDCPPSLGPLTVNAPRAARDRVRPALGRRGGVLEGGDGACRARLTRGGAASAAASRCCSVESRRASSRTSPSRPSIRTRDSRGSGSTRRRRSAWPTRS